MSLHAFTLLKETIILTAEYYGKQLTSGLLTMYVEDFEGYSPEAVVEAYRTYRRNPKNKTFPLPAQIIETLNPTASDDSRAREIAGRVREAVSRFGWNNPDDAKAYIGEIGWSVVSRFGGWQHICENLGVNLSVDTFYAQVRDQAKTQIEVDKLGLRNNPAILDFDRKVIPSEEPTGLTSAGDVLKQITGRGDNGGN